MKRDEKTQVVEELAERLRSSETLIVTDFRGLTMKELDGLRGRLLEHGARLSVVKNTLGRRAAEAAGADALLALLEGPTAIAFIDADGDMVAVAKALNDAARTTRILQIKGGVLSGSAIDAEQVRDLAALPPVETLRSQVLGSVVAPVTTFVGLLSAPLTDLVGLIDARIEQLQAQGDSSGAAAAPAEEAPAAESGTEAAAEEASEAPEAETAAEPDAAGETETETETEAAAEPAAEADDTTTNDETTDQEEGA